MRKRNGNTKSAEAAKKPKVVKPKAPKAAKKPKVVKPKAPLKSGRKRSQDDPEGFKKMIATILGKDKVAITDLKKQLREEKWKNVSNRGGKLEKSCKEFGYTVKHEKVAEGEGTRTYVLNPEKYEEPKKDAA